MIKLPPVPPPFRSAADVGAWLDVSRETVAKLELYERLLRQWQKSTNLVATASLAEAWSRHFADSAQLLRFLPAGAFRHADLGSGAGFPGLVMALLLQSEGRTDARTVLVESDQRKAAFLREVARQTATAVDIVCARIEKPETQLKIGPVDVVTARGLAALDRLCGYVQPILASGGIAILPKGRELAAELADLHRRYRLDADIVASVTDRWGRIVVVRQISALR